MDEFNENFSNCGNNKILNDTEIKPDAVKGEKNPIFKALTTIQIEEMMNDVINDVKSIVSVSLNCFSFQFFFQIRKIDAKIIIAHVESKSFIRLKPF